MKIDMTKFKNIDKLWMSGTGPSEIARLMGHDPCDARNVYVGDGEVASVIVCATCGKEVEFVYDANTGVLGGVYGWRTCEVDDEDWDDGDDDWDDDDDDDWGDDNDGWSDGDDDTYDGDNQRGDDGQRDGSGSRGVDVVDHEIVEVSVEDLLGPKTLARLMELASDN